MPNKIKETESFSKYYLYMLLFLFFFNNKQESYSQNISILSNFI